MAGVLDRVDMRTRLAGRNRLELLLFRLAGRQRYGINVFKVREVIHCPVLTRLPDSKSVVCGVAHLRGQTMSVIDLGMALGGPPVKNLKECFLIITEYNRSIQGFVVHDVDRIINSEWGDIHQPPAGLGDGSYLTAVTDVDGELVEVIDVEKVLAEVTGQEMEITTEQAGELPPAETMRPVLVADDSAIARKQITRALDRLGVQYFVATNGREALDMLQAMASEDGAAPLGERLGMVISDIEMPEMDGYTLTKEIKQDPRMTGLYVMLHSSLSGVFNEAMVERVGADRFLAKFRADDLVKVVLDNCRTGGQPGAAAA